MRNVTGKDVGDLEEWCQEELLDFVIIPDGQVYQRFLDTLPEQKVCDLIDSPDANLFETLAHMHGWGEEGYYAGAADFYNSCPEANDAFWEAHQAAKEEYDEIEA